MPETSSLAKTTDASLANITDDQKKQIVRDFLTKYYEVPAPIAMLPEGDPVKEDFAKAVMIRDTKFVPEACRGSIGDTFAYVQFCRQWDVNWTDKGAVFMTQGGSFGVATALVTAQLWKAKFKLEYPTDTDKKVECVITRPDGQTGSITWTEEHATGIKVYYKTNQIPLTQKWRNGGFNQRLMLRYRATMEAARIYASDIVKRVYNEDEIRDIAERERIEGAETPTEKVERREATKTSQVNSDFIPVELQQRITQASHEAGIDQRMVLEKLTELAHESEEKKSDLTAEAWGTWLDMRVNGIVMAIQNPVEQAPAAEPEKTKPTGGWKAEAEPQQAAEKTQPEGDLGVGQSDLPPDDLWE